MSVPFSPERADELHLRLRAFLLTTMPRETLGDIIAALQYEVVSLIASRAETKDEAVAMLESWVQAAREQIAHFGLGAPHP
jgi:hypothetical protein